MKKKKGLEKHTLFLSLLMFCLSNDVKWVIWVDHLRILCCGTSMHWVPIRNVHQHSKFYLPPVQETPSVLATIFFALGCPSFGQGGGVIYSFICLCRNHAGVLASKCASRPLQSMELPKCSRGQSLPTYFCVPCRVTRV